MTAPRTPPRRVRFTVAFLKALQPPPRGRAYWHDTAAPGLLVQVTRNGAVTFGVQRRVNGRPVRVTLGRFPPMTLESARRLANERLARMAEGINPNAAKREAKARAITLGEVLNDYLAAKTLKPKTKDLYRWLVENPAGAFADWKARPLASITRDQVERRHRQLVERSPGIANLASTVLSALFKFAAARYEHNGQPLITDNPVKRLSGIGAWCDLPRRQGYIPPAKLGAWWRATEDLEPTPRDLLRLLLLTGLRKNEGAALRWEHIDLVGGTLHVPETKNRRPLTLPLSDGLRALLAARLNDAEGTGNPYVFPGAAARGHFVAVLPACHKVAEAAGVPRMVHDLRRSFVTVAESLDVPAYTLKALLNHHVGGDVTQGYLQINVERLRAPMQRIADFILKAAGVKDTAELVEIPARRR